MFSSASPGSSPRIRGECAAVVPNPIVAGIIPANTGRIRQADFELPLGSDHPREYGENARTCLSMLWSSGSSPRIRGECKLDVDAVLKAGIIPANTGRMAKKNTPSSASRDHPREYGENKGHRRSHLTGAGSSPRIRGE